CGGWSGRHRVPKTGQAAVPVTPAIDDPPPLPRSAALPRAPALAAPAPPGARRRRAARRGARLGAPASDRASRGARPRLLARHGAQLRGGAQLPGGAHLLDDLALELLAQLHGEALGVRTLLDAEMADEEPHQLAVDLVLAEVEHPGRLALGERDQPQDRG